jgi:hypothetical protein
VFVNPYESTGEAWPTTFARLVWGIVLFQLFMLGLFAARQSWFATSGLVPLLLGTIAWSWNVREDCKGLSQHVPLATIAAAEAEHVSRLILQRIGSTSDALFSAYAGPR